MTILLINQSSMLANHKVLFANQSSLIANSKVLLANSTAIDGRGLRWWMREEFLLVDLTWLQHQLRLPHSLVLCCLKAKLSLLKCFP